ncbi:glycosyltransferase [Paenibacillus xanthanilyticus]|uniref:Glycosyltransferase n=1 Tax=Paenibacillus xanthanilyticus TaxID=1783531 RepID=A0ABV8JZR6_9BACL
MTTPLVSIIIPFYCDPYVPIAIQSALDQTYPNKEIVIVSDGSYQYNELLIPYLANNPNVYLFEKPNGGTASALNAGIRVASGEYVAWLSSDDLFYPHKLERQIADMIAMRKLISYSDYDAIDGNGMLTHHRVTPKYPDELSFYRAFAQYCPINGCTVVANRQMMLESGLFDETLPYTHDYDLWFRIAASGIKFHYVDEPLIQYRIHGGMGSMRHHEAIQHEAEFTRQRRWPQLAGYIRQLGG